MASDEMIEELKAWFHTLLAAVKLIPNSLSSLDKYQEVLYSDGFRLKEGELSLGEDEKQRTDYILWKAGAKTY